jgi:hypothetical protein
VYKEGADTERDAPEYEAGAKNEGGEAKAEWEYRYKHDPENPLTEKPKFFFTVNAHRCKEAKSGNVEISAKVDFVIVDEECKTVGNLPFKLTVADETNNAQTEKNGSYKQDGCIPGNMTIDGIVIDKDFKQPEPQDYGGEEQVVPLFLVDGRCDPVVLCNWKKVILQILPMEGESSL